MSEMIFDVDEDDSSMGLSIRLHGALFEATFIGWKGMMQVPRKALELFPKGLAFVTAEQVTNAYATFRAFMTSMNSENPMADPNRGRVTSEYLRAHWFIANAAEGVIEDAFVACGYERGVWRAGGQRRTRLFEINECSDETFPILQRALSLGGLNGGDSQSGSSVGN